jgi:hypothetical protein
MNPAVSSPYRQAILDRILDGRRIWSSAEVGGDPDVLYTQIVIPLRELKHEGVIGVLSEITAAIDGDVVIIGMEIIGPLNYEHQEEEI